jgi:hypothetical protein
VVGFLREVYPGLKHLLSKLESWGSLGVRGNQILNAELTFLSS